MKGPHNARPCGGPVTKTRAPFAVEPTSIGLQTLVPGVAPIGLVDRLAARAAAPLEPRKPQRPCDLGLFDLNARLQLDLFARPAPAPPESDR